MQVTVELLNDHALNLLYELEQMSIIRFLKTDKEVTPASSPNEKSRFARFYGAAKTGLSNEALEQKINAIRNEWERDI
jgi:hypothetical protein